MKASKGVVVLWLTPNGFHAFLLIQSTLGVLGVSSLARAIFSFQDTSRHVLLLLSKLNNLNIFLLSLFLISPKEQLPLKNWIW